MRMRRVLLLLVRPQPLRAQLRVRQQTPADDVHQTTTATNPATTTATSTTAAAPTAALLYDGGVEPMAAFLDAVAGLDPDYDRVVCAGPEPIRQYLIPQIVREELEVPPVLLKYFDLSKVTSNSDSSATSASSEVDFDEEARVMTSRLDTLSEGLCGFT